MESFLTVTTQKASSFDESAAVKNEKEGNGQYKPMKRKRKVNRKKRKAAFTAYLKNTSDQRMRFNNAKDPIYLAFEYIEDRSIVQLAVDFAKDSFFEVSKFISNVMK